MAILLNLVKILLNNQPNRLIHLTVLSKKWDTMRRINLINFFSDCDAKTVKQLSNVWESSTHEESDLTIHIITFVELLASNMVEII